MAKVITKLPHKMRLIAITSKEDKVFDVPLFVVEIKVPLHHAMLNKKKTRVFYRQRGHCLTDGGEEGGGQR